MSPGTFEPLFDPGPQRALLLAALCALVLGLLALITRHRRSSPLPLAGLAIAGVAITVLVDGRTSATVAAVGMLLLAAGGALVDLGLRSLLMRIIVALPGAWLIAFQTGLPGPDWMQWFVFLTASVAGPLISDFGRARQLSALGAPLFAISALGIFFCVPDTEEAAVLFTASAPVALLGWPVGLARLGGAGSYALVGLTAWVIVWGGQGREASLIGAVGCLGLLLAEPLARLISSRGTLLDRLSQEASPALVVGAAHFLLVTFESRVAGLRSDMTQAVLLAAAGLAAGIIALLFIRDDQSRELIEEKAGGAT